MMDWRKSALTPILCLLLGSAGITACEPMVMPIQTGAPASGAATAGLPGFNVTTAFPDSTISRGPAASGSPLDAEESAFLGLINAYRAENGAPALQLSLALTSSSKWMSEDMAAGNFFSHTDSLGRDPFTRMSQFGYDYNTDEGENIAAGNATATDTFSQWEASPEHNANMLDSSYLVIGIGRAYSASSTYGWYWTTDFGGYVD